MSQPDPPRSRLLVAGLVISAIYVLLWVTVAYLRRAELAQAPLNSIGDFLAGAFSPLALCWLVLGFFQQGIELRLTSDALRLQAKELAESSQQQMELVAATRAQVAQERELANQQVERAANAARPRWAWVTHVGRLGQMDPVPPGRIGESSLPWDGRRFTVTNVGPDCFLPALVAWEMSKEMMINVQAFWADTGTWRRGESAELVVRYSRDSPGHVVVRLIYLDATGSRGSDWFKGDRKEGIRRVRGSEISTESLRSAIASIVGQYPLPQEVTEGQQE